MELVQQGWNARGRRVQPNRQPIQHLLSTDDSGRGIHLRMPRPTHFALIAPLIRRNRARC
jgi:hypothetical protein